MATLCSIASGNLTAAATWALVDGTSYSTSETTARTLSTAYSGTRSSAFTPGAITVDAILLRLARRIGTTGTMSVSLYNSTDAADVAGTEVTINTADLPSCMDADLNGGWICLKFASPVTLTAGKNYMYQAKTSSSNQVSLFGPSGSSLTGGLRTTTTQAPVAGDDMIITGERTGAGAMNSFTVTMDSTATTDYGSANTATSTPALSVSHGGTLSYGTSAATNYYLRLSGCLIVYSGGTFNIGTTGTPIPRGSTAKLNFDCGANVDFGLIIRNLGTINAQGLSRTSGKNIWYCKLNADAAANATTLNVDTDTGWLDNDEIAVASTSQTATHSERGAVNNGSGAGASSIVVDGFGGTGGGLANAHLGTSPYLAEVILLTRSISIFGASASFQAYISIESTATVDFDWVEIYWMGSATTGKRGINLNTTTGGSSSFDSCSFHTFSVTSSGILLGSSFSLFTFNNCCFYNAAGGWFIGSTTSTLASWTISNCIAINPHGNNYCFDIRSVLGSFTNITAIGSSIGIGLNGQLSTSTYGTISNLVARAASTGVYLQNFYGGSISGVTVLRNSTTGMSVLVSYDSVFSNVTARANSSSGIILQGAGCFFINYVGSGDTTFSAQQGVSLNSQNTHNNTFINADIGTATGIWTTHTLADINILSGFGMFGTPAAAFISCKLGSTTKITGTSALSKTGTVQFQNFNQTAGDNRIYKAFGTIFRETVTTQSGTSALKMTPSSASNKLQSPVFRVSVASGQTVTPSVYVYEDASYNGARARLFLKRNDAIGVSSDTLIDTATAASDGAWEQLTGTTPAATADGVMEFYIDCDGTAGNLFMDSFTVA